MTDRVGVGIIGAGIIFEQHARALADLSDRARLVAVAEIDEARLRAATSEHGVPFGYRDHRELLERSDVDLVVVGTPPCFHEDVVIDALRAGKLVCCEKPLAHTLEAADRIIEVANEYPGRLSVIHQFRYMPEVLRTIALRNSGRLGPLVFGRFHRFARFQHPTRVRRGWWGAFDVAGGGAVMTQLIHELDLACHIFGAPLEVSAVIDTQKEAIRSEDTCIATVRFANGALVSVTGTMCAHKSSHGFEVMATEGSTHSPWKVNSLDAIWREQASAAARAAVPDAEGDSSDHTGYMRAVLDAIDAGEPLPVAPQDARVALELCAAIYASGLSGTSVRLPLDPAAATYGGVAQADYDERPRPHALVAVEG